MPKIEGDNVSNRRDADASSGQDGVASGAMVGSSAVRRGQSGVPSMFARLSLRREQRGISDQLGFLGNDNVSRRSFKYGLRKRVPRVAIAGLDGPEAFGGPPPVGVGTLNFFIFKDGTLNFLFSRKGIVEY